MVAIIKCARGRITTYHGEDIGRGFPHQGIDIGHGESRPEDLAILAPASGVVSQVGRVGTYGLRIVITHDDGSLSLIAHLAAAFVSPQQRVEQAQHIGTMGNSGTTAVHAHQEYRNQAGGAIDPLPFMTAPVAMKAAKLTDINELGDPDMPIILKTKTGHGTYTVAPGFVCQHATNEVADGIPYRQLQGAPVWEISGENLAAFVFALSGCPPTEIPAVNRVWRAA